MIKYAIHRSLTITAAEVQKAIEECRDLPGLEVSMYADGWIIVEPEGMEIEPWTRDTTEYNIEIVEKEVEKEVEENVYSRIIIDDSNDHIG